MRNNKSLIQKASLAVGLVIFIISNASANCCCCNNETTTSEHNSPGPVTPHSYQTDMTGYAPYSDGPVMASERDDAGDYIPDNLAEHQCMNDGTPLVSPSESYCDTSETDE